MSLVSPKIGLRSMVLFCRQMAQTYDAGIPLLNGLNLAAEATHDTRLRAVLERMRDGISRGDTLSAAVERERKYWPNLFIELVGAGEVGGRLKPIFYDLATYYEQRIEIRRKVIGAVIYPACLLTMLLLVATLIAAIGAMQAATGGAFDVDTLFKKFGLLLFVRLCILAGIGAVVVILARIGVWRWVTGAAKTFIWPFAGLSRKLASARFARALGLLLGAGLGARESVERAARTANNPFVTDNLMLALSRLDQGATLTEALTASPYLNPSVREMLYVGEQSGKLDAALDKAAEQLELEAMAEVYNKIRIGEVVVYLAVAACIGAFVINFYRNLYGGMLDELGI